MKRSFVAERFQFKKKFQKNRNEYFVNKKRGYDFRKREYDFRKREYYSRQNRCQDYYCNEDEYNSKIQKIHMKNEKRDNQRNSKMDDFNKYEHFSNENPETYEKIDSSEKNDGESNEQYVYILLSEFPEVCKKCETFQKKFPSNNTFHKHIRVCIAEFFSIMKFFEKKIGNFSIIKFATFVIVNNGLTFRNYNYVTV